MLWERLAPDGNATPSVYAIDGKQYMIISCGAEARPWRNTHGLQLAGLNGTLVGGAFGPGFRF